MKTTTYLKPIRRRSTPHGMSRLCFRVRDHERDIKIVSELTVKTSLWDCTRSRYKRTCRIPLPEQQRMNALVRRIIDTAEDTFDRHSDGTWLRKIIQETIHGKPSHTEQKAAETPLTNYYERFATERYANPRSRKTALAALKKIASWENYCQSALCSPQRSLSLDTIDSTDIDHFHHYLRQQHQFSSPPDATPHPHAGRPKAKKALSPTTIVNTMNMLRAYLRWCVACRLTSNSAFLQAHYPTATYGTPIYLNLAERDSIYHADLSDNPRLATIRDMFLFQSLTGMRASDLFALTSRHISPDGILEYIPQKTLHSRPTSLRIPLGEKAMEILHRHLDPMHSERPLFPPLTMTSYNAAIRQLLKAVGIGRRVTVVDAAEGGTTSLQLWQTASSHLARRTFVANIYRGIADPDIISSMTGHAPQSRAFRRYREIDLYLCNQAMATIR